MKHEQISASPIAIVTGGAQGIGRGTVEHLIAQGWRVAVFDLDGDALDEMDTLAAPDAILTIKADVGRERAVAKAFDRFAAWAGAPERLDLLVNNSGIADPVSGALEDLALKDWQRWIDASLTAAFLCSRAAIPLLRRPSGAIVHIGSTRAVQSEPDCEAYAAAKGGLLALTHAMAVSLGPQIRVNAVLPGWIETGPWQKADQRSTPDHRPIDRKQHPAGRVGEPHDIASAVEWLAGRDSTFVTGQAIAVDGGMTRRMHYAP